MLPSLLLSAPHGDNVEQLNWSHGVQAGYFKHPPLPTWLLAGAIELFGRSAALTYALAMACVAAALTWIWQGARLVLDRERALYALLLSTANYYLMGRGSFLNHNTVMLPFVALSAWAVLRIIQGASWRMWLVLGLAQALGLLTKYQMSVVVLANGLALLAAGTYRKADFGRHVALASAATLVPLVPHALWLTRHQFSSFDYASHSLLAGLSLAQRVPATLGFLAQQVGRLAPAALVCLLAAAIAACARRSSISRPATRPGPAAPLDPAVTRALLLLALTPLAAIVALSLGAGVAPQNHWGASSTLLLPLLFVVLARGWLQGPIAAAALATGAVHLGAIVWNVVVWARNPGAHHTFAARPLAALAQARWAEHQPGPLRLVLGPDWEAGSIALYLPSQPAVVPGADWRQAPWVDPDLLSRCGALIVGRPGVALEQQVSLPTGTHLTDPATLSSRDALGRESSIQFALVAPTVGSRCP